MTTNNSSTNEVINNNNKDTHIYNIINNPPKIFTEPCEACGVSEFQLGVKHAEERIIKLLERDLDVLPEFARAIDLIKGEQK